MKRLFWFGVGVAAGVAASRKVASVAHQATPAGLGANVGEGLRELADALGSFGADVRAGMTEREHELQETVEEKTGFTPGRHNDGRVDRTRLNARARRASG
jgi:hypothetical protein